MKKESYIVFFSFFFLLLRTSLHNNKNKLLIKIGYATVLQLIKCSEIPCKFHDEIYKKDSSNYCTLHRQQEKTWPI
jgi:hypothetical protein